MYVKVLPKMDYFFSFKNNYKIGIDVVGGFHFCIVCGGVCWFAFFFVFVF